MADRGKTVKRKRPPLQPIGLDQHQCVRFQENQVVRCLLDEASNRGFNLNQLAAAAHDAPRSDWEQFFQLIGYSLSGFGELSYVRDSTYERAQRKADTADTGKGGER